MARRAGVNVPLFSLRSSTGWGIGELPDIVPLSSWLGESGLSQLMVLPLGTIPEGESSPYSATSTFAIDPMYIAIEALPDFARAGGVPSLSRDAQDALAAARASAAVRHDLVRRAKHEALNLAFASFAAEEWEQLTPRGAELAAYVARERWWLDDYALFNALSSSMPGTPWREWATPLRDRDARALDDARRQLGREVLRQQYWQWIAERQWQEARLAAARHAVTVVGDLPFVVGSESPEIWVRADEVLLDVSAGVPPDAFSESGQDWGLPTYAWEVIARNGYLWMQQRARRMAALFDGLRVDHVVGLYRTYARPENGEPYFIPAEEPAQVAQGEAVLTILKQTGLELIAEDLGVIPDFVRASLTAQGVPGCRVLRWERRWSIEGCPFLLPETYPALSVAMTGTHDTEPMAAWWEESAESDRVELVALPIFHERGLADPQQPWSDTLRDTIIELVLGSGSDDAFLPIQDVFGWRDRINTPATVGPANWTWRLPWAVDHLHAVSEAVERTGFLRRVAAATERIPASDYTRAQPPEGVQSE